MELYKNSEISVHDLKKLVDKNKNIQILDIREYSERKHAFINATLPNYFLPHKLLLKVY